MAGPATDRAQRARDWLLGHDDVVDFASVVGVFVLYGMLDAATRLAADVHVDRLEDSVLLVGAFVSNPAAFIVLLGALGVAVWRWPSRLWSRWGELDAGGTLRLLAAPLLALLAWQGSLYEFNFLLGQTHAPDRFLLVALALASLARPVFLVPFVVEARVIADQFDYPFETRAAQNIDELLVIALLAIAAVHVFYVLTGRRQTAPVVLVLAAAIATHFYIPGKSKLALGWLGTTDISNLPFGGYTAGWRGQGDGSWAEQMSSFARALGKPGLAATLSVELGSLVAMLHHRLLRLWLPMCVVFHTLVFAFVGYWFFPWIVLELALVVLLTRSTLQPWLEQNATPARALLTVGAVVIAGSTLFHPPALSWLDAPVSYGYRVEAIGQSGTLYQVPASAFAPLEQEVAFYRLRIGPDEPISGAYGAVISTDVYRDLQKIVSFADVEAREVPTDPVLRTRAREFMSRFMDQANSRGPSWWSAISPPDHFWTGSPGPAFDFNEPLDQLDIYVLTAFHADGKQEFRRELVLTLTVGLDGLARPS